MGAEVDRSELARAFERQHGWKALGPESVPVVETFQGAGVRNGEVQVSELLGHATATRGYARFYPTGGSRTRFHAVLDVGPADSSRTPRKPAVCAAIPAELRGKP